MTFVYCDSCHWVQDDFWDPIWHNPIQAIEDAMLKEELFKDGPLELDKEEAEDRSIEYIEPLFTEDKKIRKVLVDRKDYVAARLEEFARTITNMEFRNLKEFEEYKKRNGLKCPKCGELTLQLLGSNK